MPLALELAASQIRAISAVEIANMITRNVQSLSTDLQNIPLRHRKMRAVSKVHGSG